MIFRRKKRRIEQLLLVEDEPLVAFDNEHFLGAAGFEIVATVDSVADALRTIASAPEIDLVLVDVSLSDGSGVEGDRGSVRHRQLPRRGAGAGRGMPVETLSAARPAGGDRGDRGGTRRRIAEAASTQLQPVHGGGLIIAGLPGFSR